jgi:FtsP/CotA-like multicopper oxidase with cupredoxin domain
MTVSWHAACEMAMAEKPLFSRDRTSNFAVPARSSAGPRNPMGGNMKKHLSTALKLALLAGLVALLPGSEASAAVRSYTVYATDGYVTMADGTVMYAFGYNDTGVMGQIQFPAPLVWGNIGDEIQLTLVNLGFKYRPDLMDPHTIHLHGLHVVPYFDGFPEGSFEIPMGGSFTYKFMAMREGAYMYHCHVEAVEHVQMGMYGPLVVYGGAQKQIHGRNYVKEYIWLVSEFDSRWHRAMEPGAPELEIPEIDQSVPEIGYAEWVRVNYRPDYWLINGMSFPDTIREGAQLPLLTHDPADPEFVAGIQNGIFVANGQAAHSGLQQSALIDVMPDEPVLVRIINMGYQAHPLHLHGDHFELLGSDAMPLPHLQTQGRKGGNPQFKKFTINIGSGETYDTIVNLSSENLCMSQSLVPDPEESPFPEFTSPLYDPDGPYFFPMHCHDDYHVTDRGVYPAGMATLVKVARPTCSAP